MRLQPSRNVGSDAITRERPSLPGGAAATAGDAGLRPFYFTVVFWGSVYRDYFTDLLLASLLSPNNIPALSRRRNNKFLIATPRADWEVLQEHTLFRRLKAYAEPEWLELEVNPDDHKMRAMSRGHRLVTSRAFEDRAYGVFVTPDLILSDGSVAAMERFAEAGKKVVLAVAIRYQHEPILAELKHTGFLRPGEPLAIRSRDLMRIALRHLHSETLRYEYDAPWFTGYPVSVYWQVPGGDGVIIHSFSWSPLVVDYGALARHDLKTFDYWTLDGDYIHRNFPTPSDVHVVTDSDEITLVSFTKESDLHFELRPYLAGRAGWILDWYRNHAIQVLKDSTVMDPLKRHIFPTPVYLHSGEISDVWAQVRSKATRIIAKAYAPVGFWDWTADVATTLAAPDLKVQLGIGGPASFPCWCWLYRRFVWQRVKEKSGFARSRSRLDDGRDWVGPSFGLMNPIFSVRASFNILGWHWRYRRYLWQRVKEKMGFARGRSRSDDGRDWVSPAVGPMNPIWSLQVTLLRAIGARRSPRASTGVQRRH